MKLIKFKSYRNDDGWVWVNPDHVFAIRKQIPKGAIIVANDYEVTVDEPIQDVVDKLLGYLSGTTPIQLMKSLLESEEIEQMDRRADRIKAHEFLVSNELVLYTDDRYFITDKGRKWLKTMNEMKP